MTFAHTTLANVFPRRDPRAKRGDTNIALIMFIMMSLVFGPVIGLHLYVAMAPDAAPSALVSRDTTPPAIPPG